MSCLKTLTIIILHWYIFVLLDVPTIILQASTWPPTEERCRHVSPRLLRTVTEAPAALSMWHISALPASAARWSAVSPHSFLALSRARNCLVCSRRWTTSAFPSLTAENKSKVVILYKILLKLPSRRLLRMATCACVDLKLCVYIVFPGGCGRRSEYYEHL